jgi:hypothetical protein
MEKIFEWKRHIINKTIHGQFFVLTSKNPKEFFFPDLATKYIRDIGVCKYHKHNMHALKKNLIFTCAINI